MKTINKFLIITLILIIFTAPILSFAQTSTGLVRCGRVADSTANPPRLVADPACTFDDIMNLINRVINFILTTLVIPIAAIMFAYAGVLLVTAGGEVASKRTKAKEIFTNALIGLVIAVACWLIVKTVLSILGYGDIGLFF